jgi:hypothetical protein
MKPRIRVPLGRLRDRVRRLARSSSGRAREGSPAEDEPALPGAAATKDAPAAKDAPATEDAPGAEDAADGAAPPAREPGELLGIGVAMMVALSLVALLVVLVAPTSSGCGTRGVGDRQTASATPAPTTAPSGAGSTATAEPVAPVAEPEAEVETAPPPPQPSALVGDYECRFTRGDRELRPVPCAIRAGDDGAMRLEQSGGPVRLSGTVSEDEAGLRLTGEVLCSAGPCPAPGSRDILFFSQGASGYSAVLPLRSGLLLNIDLVRKN